VHTIVVREASGPIDRLRPLALAVADLPRSLFVGWTADPPAVIVAVSADSDLDAGRLLRSALEPVAGRGGGNPRMAQGTAPTASAIEAALGAIRPV
jgi:alanyl-tRNA synthetase